MPRGLGRNAAQHRGAPELPCRRLIWRRVRRKALGRRLLVLTSPWLLHPRQRLGLFLFQEVDRVAGRKCTGSLPMALRGACGLRATTLFMRWLSIRQVICWRGRENA